MVKSNKKRLSLLQKLLIIIITIVLVIMLCAVGAVNITLAKNEHQPFMQKLPFLGELYFCPTTKAVANQTFQEGSVFLVKKRTSYQDGDTVAIPNTGTVFDPAIPVLVGEVQNNNNKLKGKAISVKIGDTDTDTATISLDAVYGTIELSLPYLGKIYLNLIGLKGYIFFGLIPLLCSALLIALLARPTKSTKLAKQSNSNNTQVYQDIEVLVAQVIRTTAPSLSGFNNSNGGQKMDERPRGIIETVERINDTTVVITRKEGYLDEAPQQQPAEPVEPAETAETKIETAQERSERQLADITMRANAIDFGEVKSELDTPPSDEPTPKLPADEPEKEQQHEVMLDQEDEVVPSMVVAAVKSQVDKEILADVTANVMNQQDTVDEPVLELPKKLPASEIVKLYRLSKQPENARNNATEHELFTMAKLYYDSNIESYTKNKANN